MKYQNISRKGTWFALIIFTIVFLALIYLIVIRESGDPLAKFSEYFKGDDIVHIEYATEGDEKSEIWADYKNGNFKEVTTRNGKVKLFSLSDRKTIIDYDDFDRNITNERFNHKSEPWLLHTARAAIEGRLIKDKEKGDVSYYVYENYNENEDPRWVSSAKIGISNADGKLRFLMDDEMISIVKNMETLSASEGKNIFNLEPLPDEIKKKAKQPGYTPEALQNFKSYTPYWLGPEVNGIEATRIEGMKIPGSKEYYIYITYGSAMEPDIAVHEFDFKEKSGREEWDITVNVKKKVVAGYNAKLQDSKRLVVKAGSTIVRIDGNGLKDSSELVKVVEENLEKVPR